MLGMVSWLLLVAAVTALAAAAVVVAARLYRVSAPDRPQERA